MSETAPDRALRLAAQKVLKAYGVEGEIEPVRGGLLSDTFIVRSTRSFCLQRISRIFPRELHDDIEAITCALRDAAVEVPALVRTLNNKLCVVRPDIRGEPRVWRLSTWIDGQAIQRSGNVGQLCSAARLVARFHTALIELDHSFSFRRPGAHNTPGHLERLRVRCSSPHPRGATLVPLAQRILSLSTTIIDATAPPELPKRIIHGDLKLSNLVFRGEEAVAIIDLDTLAYGDLQVELGDALRSWANPRGEEVATKELYSSELFDPKIASAVIDAYEKAASWITDEERSAVRRGPARIALELAARFCLDAFEESYFAFDQTRYESSSAHQEARARVQLEVAMAAQSWSETEV